MPSVSRRGQFSLLDSRNGGSEGGSEISGSFWSRQRLGAMAFADLATDKVEDPLDVARCQTEASNSLGASSGSELEC